MKRDLSADLAICNAATPGEWFVMHDTDVDVEDPPGSGYTTGVAWCSATMDARFIAEAHAGWPDAIRRAMAAEETLAWIIGAYDRGDLRQTRMSSGTDYVIQRCRAIISK